MWAMPFWVTLRCSISRPQSCDAAPVSVTGWALLLRNVK
jgi:hypothetical protein